MTTHAPRDYQEKLDADICAAWAAGHRNVLAVLPTGGGKTYIFSRIIERAPYASCAIAHRQELVAQMSLALARESVRHRVIGPPAVARICTAWHMLELQRSFENPRALAAVAGIDTLVRMDPKADPWFGQVGLWVQDEAHHLLRENKWGRGVAMFPNAFGLGVTATACRTDGQGLGREADGLMDAIVEGPSMRQLIDRGFLTPYRIFAPPSDVDYSQVTVTASGDLSPAKLSEAVHRSANIIGDVVGHYLKIAQGKLGVTFAVDIEAATEYATAYKAAGVPAEVVTSKTPQQARAAILRKFRNRQILQLVNVDLFGEGFDLPAVEVVSMVRKTESYGLYCQQFGRALRILEGKTHALIIDHVGNVQRHGLPDAPREWKLGRRDRQRSGEWHPPITVCPKCTGAYEAFRVCCPFCSYYPEPIERATPEAVQGDLHELDAATLAALRGEVAFVDGMAPRIPVGAAPEVVARIKRLHFERQQAQAWLRQVMALFGGWAKHEGRDDRETQRMFFHRFGVDVMTAMTLGATKARELAEQIKAELLKRNIAI